MGMASYTRLQRVMEAGRSRPRQGPDQESEAVRQIVQALGPDIDPVLYRNFGGSHEEALRKRIAKLREGLTGLDPEVREILLSAALALYVEEGGDTSR
eukprot:13030928-Alexandrium_andersonii.AAC.1